MDDRTGGAAVNATIRRAAPLIAGLLVTTVGAVALGERVDAAKRTGTRTTASTSAMPAGYGLWSETATPENPSEDDDDRVKVGVRFSTARAGVVTGIQFYKGRGNVGPHVGHLWTAGGTRLARVEFPGSTGTGWQTATLSTPVRLTPGTRYIASYTAPEGHYAEDEWELSPTRPVTAGDLTAWAGTYTYGSGAPLRTWHDSNYYVDVVFSPDTTAAPPAPPAPTPTVAPTTAPTPAPTPTVTPTVAPTATSTTATPTPTPTVAPTTTAPTTPAPTSPPSTGGFPNAANTGVPAGTALTAYTGPCTITTANTVIDAKTVNCDLAIRAAGVVIKNSRINGTVASPENSTAYSFTIQDSEVAVGDRPGTGIGATNFTVLRVEVTGGNRSINCWINCTVRDSYVHGQMSDETGVYHESGIRMGKGGTIVHNSIACDAPDFPPDAGCSASLTGYGDFAPVEDMLVQNNLLMASTGGTCAYGGSSGGKPYSDDANNIRFLDNVFQRGRTGKCGYWAPIVDFDRTAPGNVWSGNVWEDGGIVTP